MIKSGDFVSFGFPESAYRNRYNGRYVVEEIIISLFGSDLVSVVAFRHCDTSVLVHIGAVSCLRDVAAGFIRKEVAI